MARRVPPQRKQHSYEVNRILDRDISSNAMYKQCQKKKCPILTSKSQIQQMLKEEQKKHPHVKKVSVGLFTRSEYHATGNKRVEGIARLNGCIDNKNSKKRNYKIEVKIHPIVKYSPPSVAKEIVGHEFDHTKVYKKHVDSESWWKRQQKIASKVPVGKTLDTKKRKPSDWEKGIFDS